MLQFELEKRRAELLRLIMECEGNIARAPQGTLRVVKNGKKIQYYWRMNTQDIRGKYIQRKDEWVAHALAQKDYCAKFLKKVKKEKEQIDQMIQSFGMQNLTDVYEKLNNYRKEIVNPLIETNEMFAEKWEKENYKGKCFRDEGREVESEYYTKRQERVRSKSEILIANSLFDMGIPYKYECPLLLKKFGYVYPDFTLLRTKTREVCYLEHFGMMDDESYQMHFFKKVSTYTKNGIISGKNLYMTIESKTKPLSIPDLECQLREWML